MTLSIRSSFLLGVLALAFVLAGSALAGVLPIAPQQALAADETGEETTTTPEEPPPVIETPTEPETTPEPETPTTTPPVTTPPVTAPSGGSEGGGGTVETPKSTPPSGTATGGSGAVSGGGGSSGGGSSSGGSAGSGSTGGTTTTTPSTSPSRNTARTPTRTTNQRNGGGGNNNGGSDSNSQIGAGGGGSRNTGGGGATTGQQSPSAGGGGRAPQPTVSPQAIDEGASAVTNAASHVGEAFAEALPTAPLKKIGDQLAAHIAGAGPAGGGKEQKQTADQIGTALGAALLGSAVAVDRTPPASSSPLPFFTPPGGKSGTIYLILIAALVLVVGALVFREARSALGFDKPRTGVRVADEKPRIALSERVGVALAGLHGATHRWFSRARRLRANAAAGLRSLF